MYNTAFSIIRCQVSDFMPKLCVLMVLLNSWSMKHTLTHLRFQVRMTPSCTWSSPEPWWVFWLLVCLFFAGGVGFFYRGRKKTTSMQGEKEACCLSCPGQWPEWLVVPCSTFVQPFSAASGNWNSHAMQKQAMLISSLGKQAVHCSILVSWNIILVN